MPNLASCHHFMRSARVSACFEVGWASWARAALALAGRLSAAALAAVNARLRRRRTPSEKTVSNSPSNACDFSLLDPLGRRKMRLILRVGNYSRTDAWGSRGRARQDEAAEKGWFPSKGSEGHTLGVKTPFPKQSLIAGDKSPAYRPEEIFRRL